LRGTLLFLSTMILALLLAGGVALAANIQCLGGPCTGTEQNDRITGSLVDDIEALGGGDDVNARSGDDFVAGGRGPDDISGGLGADSFLLGNMGPDDIDGGPGTPDGDPRVIFECTITDPSTGTVVARTEGNQILQGDEGSDDLDGGRDNDLLRGGPGRNDLSGKGGDDCLELSGP
jgi:Ca2+-binding RTX toxin-like protein